MLLTTYIVKSGQVAMNASQAYLLPGGVLRTYEPFGDARSPSEGATEHD